MTDGMSENAREVREARGHAPAATPTDAERWPNLFGNGAKRERERASPNGDDCLPDVPEDETPREKVARLRVEVRLAQARTQFVRDLATHQADYVTTNTHLRLRCTNLEQDVRALKGELAVLRELGRTGRRNMDKIPRMEPALLNLRPSTTSDIRTSAPAAAAAPAAPPPSPAAAPAAPPEEPPPEEELDPAEEEAIHAAELRAHENATALRVRDNLLPSPPPMEEEDEDTGDYEVAPAYAARLPGYDGSNPSDRKMRDLVLRGKLCVEDRAHREVVAPGPEGSRSDIFENKETFKLLTHRFYFDSATKLWGRAPAPAQ